MFTVKPPLLAFTISCCLALIFGFLFVVFDFPPIWLLLDAHACWHATTACIAFLFYSYFRNDIEKTLIAEGKKVL